MSNGELINKKESNTQKNMTKQEREIIDLDEKLKEEENKTEVTEDLKSSFKKILSKKQEASKNEECAVKNNDDALKCDDNAAKGGQGQKSKEETENENSALKSDEAIADKDNAAKSDEVKSSKSASKGDEAIADKDNAAKSDEVKSSKSASKGDEVNNSKSASKGDEIKSSKSASKGDEVNNSKSTAKGDEVYNKDCIAKSEEVKSKDCIAKSDEAQSKDCTVKSEESAARNDEDGTNSLSNSLSDSYKNEILLINQKLDILCEKLNEERIRNDLESKSKFKKLLDTVSSHLNVQLVNSVENTIKREVKTGMLQLKKTVGESAIAFENKSTNIINEINQKKMELPENNKILETVKNTMVDIFLPIIESCVEEMKSQILVEIRKNVALPEASTKAISMKQEIVGLLQNENINDACVLALDCGDDLLSVFVDNCSAPLLEKLDPSLQGHLLKKSVSVFSDFDNDKITSFISNILMILEIQDLNVSDLVELQNILEFLNSVDAANNENMKLIIKMQGNQIKKLITKKRR